ncbi:MAG: hypothetical protein CBB71_00915 [Rhodopirellula sp. TMED11]|nr:MAG: hypothetical protein CBB71_00915 [Rhodopirellula sp. TMED11]
MLAIVDQTGGRAWIFGPQTLGFWPESQVLLDGFGAAAGKGLPIIGPNLACGANVLQAAQAAKFALMTPLGFQCRCVFQKGA